MVRDKIVELLFPRRCIVCDEPVEAGKEPVCPSCREELQYVEDPFCMRCGKQLLEEREYCEDCRSREEAFSSMPVCQMPCSVLRIREEGNMRTILYGRCTGGRKNGFGRSDRMY